MATDVGVDRVELPANARHARRCARPRTPPGTRARGLAVTALMLLPGALVVFMGFNAGGYFPAAPAVAAIVLAQILLVRIVQLAQSVRGVGARHARRDRRARAVRGADARLGALVALERAGADRVRPRVPVSAGARSCSAPFARARRTCAG